MYRPAYLLTTKNYMHFSLVDISTGETAHTFEGAAKAKGCLPGQIVYLEGEQCKPHPEHPFSPSPIVGVIHLRSRTIYGMTARNVPIYLFYPLDSSYPPFRVGCSERDRSHNRLAIVYYDNWRDGEFPRANLDRVIGTAGAIPSEILALEAAASPSWREKPHIPLPAAAEPAAPIDPADGWWTANIDPEGCRDIDDAISYKAQPDGSYEVAVSIANVYEQIATTPLWPYAQRTAQTVYDDGRAVRPMLPPQYSEDRCSLLPGQWRDVVSYMFTWRPGSPPSEGVFKRACLFNQQSYSYDTIRTLAPEPSAILERLTADIDLCLPQEDPHKWVESFMLLYNRSAAAVLKAAGDGILRRQAKPADVILPPDDRELASLLERMAAASGEYCMATAEQTEHHSLATAAYCHASSPIRRFADLYNQGVLLKTLGCEESIEHLKPSTPPLPVLINTLNVHSKGCKRFERDAFFLRWLDGEGSRINRFSGTVISDNFAHPEKKLRIWVPAWKRIVSWRTTDTSIQIGAHLDLEMYLDISQPNWKNRLVIRKCQ